MDVSLNKPFKFYVCRYWSNYVLEQPDTLQHKRKLQPPRKKDVASWISSALDEMQKKAFVVVQSFEACGILNCFDRSVHPDELLEGQYDELEDPFNEADTLTCDSDLT